LPGILFCIDKLAKDLRFPVRIGEKMKRILLASNNLDQLLQSSSSLSHILEMGQIKFFSPDIIMHHFHCLRFAGIDILPFSLCLTLSKSSQLQKLIVSGNLSQDIEEIIKILKLFLSSPLCQSVQIKPVITGTHVKQIKPIEGEAFRAILNDILLWSLENKLNGKDISQKEAFNWLQKKLTKSELG